GRWAAGIILSTCIACVPTSSGSRKVMPTSGAGTACASGRASCATAAHSCRWNATWTAPPRRPRSRSRRCIMTAREDLPALDPAPLMKLSTAYWDAQTLLTANRIGLFGLLGDNTLDVEAIARALHTRPRPTRLLLKACVAL